MTVSAARTAAPSSRRAAESAREATEPTPSDRAAARTRSWTQRTSRLFSVRDKAAAYRAASTVGTTQTIVSALRAARTAFGKAHDEIVSSYSALSTNDRS